MWHEMVYGFCLTRSGEGIVSVRSGWYGAVPLSRQLLGCRVREGDRVVDATCGNGNDTLFLAGLVGPSGHVTAFDLQQEAIDRTRALLNDAGLGDRVTLVHDRHERMSEHVAPPVRAIVFNLGYLPGGGRRVVTSADSSLAAVESGMGLLGPGGCLVVAVYTGHDEGREADALLSFFSGVDPATWNVWRMFQLNRSSRAPFLIVAEKVCEVFS